MPDRSVLAKAGDAVMFRSDVWHRGGGNTCGKPRHIIQVFYIDSWLVERFCEGWDEERMWDADAKQRAAAHSFPGGPSPNPDAILKAKLSKAAPEFCYPPATLAAASSELRALLEPVATTGAAYQQVISAAMRAQLRSMGKSSLGEKRVLIDRLHGRVP